MKEKFPSARLLFCHFHVQKALFTELVKAKYDLDAFHKKQLKAAVSALIYARSEERYSSIIEHVKVLLGVMV